MKLNNKGFTLVEVLAVVVILGLIGGIAVNGVLSSINTSKDTSYNIMISDIVVASEILYQEVEFGNKIKTYNNNGITNNEVMIINNRDITTNLQTLVSNGYLSGNENSGNFTANKNERLIINPKTDDDISSCEITIRKNNDEYTVFNSSSDSKCPTIYKKEVK